MSDDTPTQRLSAADGDAGELVEERKKSRTLLFVLIGVGAALLVAVAVLVTVLVLQPRPGTVPVADPTPAPSEVESSPTPTPTPTATPTPTSAPSADPVETSAPPPPPPPPDTTPGFSSFSAPAVTCPAPVDAGEELGPPAIIRFSYTAKNAQEVWFVFGDEDAANTAVFPMPLSGDQDDVYDSTDPIYFPCNAASSTMTLTVVGDDGTHVNKTFAITNNGYRD